MLYGVPRWYPEKKFIQIEKSCTRLFTIITDFKGSVLILHVNI